jgi:HEPN domain-containing protein
MTPAEDARLLLRLVERHLGSLRGSLASESFADEDWGFLAQQTLEKLLKAWLVLNAEEPPRSHSLQRLIQVLEGCGETITLAPELLALDDFAVLARYDADPTPLPADRGRLLELLERLHQELHNRVG